MLCQRSNNLQSPLSRPASQHAPIPIQYFEVLELNLVLAIIIFNLEQSGRPPFRVLNERESSHTKYILKAPRNSSAVVRKAPRNRLASLSSKE